MLALSLTFLAATFILGPDLLSRWILSFVVPRRSLSQNRGEEVMRAIVWAAGPLALVILWTWVGHTLASWGSWGDVRVVSSGLYSSSFFDGHTDAFFRALPRVLGMVGSLLWRLYLIVLVCAVALDVAILRYSRLRSMLKPQWAKSLLASVVLPRVSEWHVLLSDMLLPTAEVYLGVDVLTKSGTLYEGEVQDRMLGADGSLQTLTLAGVRRFSRDAFHKALELDGSVRREDFWRNVPGELFVILGSDIASLNVRYEPKRAGASGFTLELSKDEAESVRSLLSKLSVPGTNGGEGI